VVVSQDLKVAETAASLKPSLVGIFKALNPKTAADATKPAYYSLNEPLFTGLIMTTDGWVLAAAPPELRKNFVPANYVALTSDRKVYALDQVADDDNLPGDWLLFHLTNASNLPVKKIVARAELSLGESLLVIKDPRTVWPTTLVSLAKTGGVLSSDALNERLVVNESGEVALENSLVFDLSGNLAALIGDTGEVLPAFSLDYYWQNLLKQKPATRPFLGLNYLDLSAVKLSALSDDKGALVYPAANGVAVLKNSPAAAAGLKAGDIITWVNNQEINADNDLSQLIAGHNPGDDLTLTYRRSGQEETATVKLAELK